MVTLNTFGRKQPFDNLMTMSWNFPAITGLLMNGPTCFYHASFAINGSNEIAFHFDSQNFEHDLLDIN
jgi:hypothetical protein